MAPSAPSAYNQGDGAGNTNLSSDPTNQPPNCHIQHHNRRAPFPDSLCRDAGNTNPSLHLTNLPSNWHIQPRNRITLFPCIRDYDEHNTKPSLTQTTLIPILHP